MAVAQACAQVLEFEKMSWSVWVVVNQAFCVEEGTSDF